MMSETFYVGLYSALMGFVLAMSAQCYRSKCREVKFCCIKIIRDVEGEEALDVQQQIPQNHVTHDMASPAMSQNGL
jgi:hypothetical protein